LSQLVEAPKTGSVPATDQNAATARSSLAQASERCLHRLVGREENRDLAAGQLRSQLCARLTEDLAVNHGDRRKDCPEEVAKVRGVLDGRLGVPVPLEDHALGLVVVEVDVVLKRSGVLRPHDLHGLSGQALELLELALAKLEASDTQKLTHGSTSRLLLAGWDRRARLPGRASSRSW
jgi:hypothetical protein